AIRPGGEGWAGQIFKLDEAGTHGAEHALDPDDVRVVEARQHLGLDDEAIEAATKISLKPLVGHHHSAVRRADRPDRRKVFLERDGSLIAHIDSPVSDP